MIPGLQEWIHSIEEGAGAKYLKIVALLLGLIALAVVYNIREVALFSRPEAMDAAQLGRNIAEGEGYTTKFIRPVSAALIEGVRGEHQGAIKGNHPDLANPPVYPLLLAGLMKVVPMNWKIDGANKFASYQPELMITLLNQLIFFGCMVMTFLLGRKLFEPAVGWVAAVVLGLTELMWRFTSSGLSSMLLILLLLLLVWALLKIEEKVRPAEAGPLPLSAEPEAGSPPGRSVITWAALAGLILGIGCLTRYSFGWLLLPVIAWLAVFGASKRAATAVACAAVFLAVVLPWVARNYQASHTLFGTAGFAIHQGVGGNYGHYLERSMPRNAQRDLNQIPIQSYVRKGLTNTAEILKDELPRLGGSWLTGLFLAGLLVPYRNPAISKLRWLLLGFLLVLIIAQALGKTEWSAGAEDLHSENLLALTAPLVFLFGIGFFFLLIDQIEFPLPQLRSAAILGLILAASLPMIFLLMPPQGHPVQYPPYYPPMIQEGAGYMDKEELMMSDMPWAVAWYGNRKCMWVTLDTGGGKTSDFYRIHDYQKAIQALYLTPITTNTRFVTEMLKGQEGAWSRFMLKCLMETNVPKGFPLQSAPNGWMPEQMFLSDRARWRMPAK